MFIFWEVCWEIVFFQIPIIFQITFKLGIMKNPCRVKKTRGIKWHSANCKWRNATGQKMKSCVCVCVFTRNDALNFIYSFIYLSARVFLKNKWQWNLLGCLIAFKYSKEMLSFQNNYQKQLSNKCDQSNLCQEHQNAFSGISEHTALYQFPWPLIELNSVNVDLMFPNNALKCIMCVFYIKVMCKLSIGTREQPPGLIVEDPWLSMWYFNILMTWSIILWI